MARFRKVALLRIAWLMMLAVLPDYNPSLLFLSCCGSITRFKIVFHPLEESGSEYPEGRLPLTVRQLIGNRWLIIWTGRRGTLSTNSPWEQRPRKQEGTAFIFFFTENASSFSLSLRLSLSRSLSFSFSSLIRKFYLVYSSANVGVGVTSLVNKRKCRVRFVARNRCLLLLS